jgi:hypothetical protein
LAQSIELPDEIAELVRREAQVQGRSMADQVAHWLSIGRAIEAPGRFSGSSIAKALAAEIPPSALTAEEHAVWMDLFIEKMGKSGLHEQAFFGRRTNHFAEGVIGEVPARIMGRPGVERRGR